MTPSLPAVADHITTLLPSGVRLVALSSGATSVDAFDVMLRDDFTDTDYGFGLSADAMAQAWWRASVRKAIGHALRGFK